MVVMANVLALAQIPTYLVQSPCLNIVAHLNAIGKCISHKLRPDFTYL